MLLAERRSHDPEFRVDRLLRAAFTQDSAPVEVFVGGWIVMVRGLMLAQQGFAYPQIARLLGEFGVTDDRLGFLLISAGVAQMIAVGTHYYRVRALISFLGSLCCFAVWLAYIGIDMERTGIAWTWFALMVSETALCWRILLNWRAVQEAGRDSD